MSGPWQQRKQNDGQELWAKDRVMASQNAMNIALGLVQLEQTAQAELEAPPSDLSVKDRFLELYEGLYDIHLQRGGDVGAAVATVTRAFPGSEVGVAPSAPPVGGGQHTLPSGGPGDALINFGKHNGLTVAQVYATDPSYIRNFLAVKAREPEMRAAVAAFLAQVDAA